MCVYSGMEHEHWRHLYQGYKHSQCFLVYVDAEGDMLIGSMIKDLTLLCQSNNCHSAPSVPSKGAII